MQDETLRARAGASASYGDICALAFAGVCLGHRRGKAVAWCTALALLVLAFVAAGFTLRQRAQRAQ